MVADSVTQDLAIALRDTKTFSALALTRAHELAFGVEDVRPSAGFWTYLRARSYARHAAATFVTRLAEGVATLTTADEDPTERVINLFVQDLASWRTLREFEQELIRQRFFASEWTADALAEQILERGAGDRILELAEIDRERPLISPLILADETAEIREPSAFGANAERSALSSGAS